MKHFPYTLALKIDDKVVHRMKWRPNKDMNHTLMKAEKSA